MQKRLDGGYGWAVVVAHFIVSGLVFGNTKISGVMFVYFQEEYNATFAATSTIALGQRLTEASTAIFFSILAEHFGSRPIMLIGSCFMFAGTVSSVFAKSIAHLTITYGVLIGLAGSMLGIPSAQMLPKYFDKKVAMASAIAFTGTSVGPLLLPFLVRYTIGEYGLSGSFWILAGVYAHVLVGAVLMRPPSFFNKPISDKMEEGDGNVKKTGPTFMSTLGSYKACFCNKTLLLFFLAQLLVGVATMNFISFQQAFAKDRGITDPTLLVLLTSVWGVSEIIAKLLGAFILQKDVIHPFRLYQLGSLALSAALFVYPTLESYWSILFFSSLVAFVFSTIFTCLIPIFRLIVGIELCSPAFGLLALPMLVAFSSVQLAGFVRDYARSFTPVFVVAAIALLFAIVVIEIVAFQTKVSMYHKISAALRKRTAGPQADSETAKGDL